MLMSLFEAYQQFIQKEPNMRVGKSKFCSLRPNWIKTITPHDGCACVYHQNPTLMITAWNRINGQAIDLKGLISAVICSTTDSACYSRDCATCGDRLPSEVLLSNFNGNEDDEVNWMRWKRTEKRVELQRISGSISSIDNTNSI
jgi:hypothetical protein